MKKSKPVLSPRTRAVVRNAASSVPGRRRRDEADAFVDLLRIVNRSTGAFGDFIKNYDRIYGVDMSPSGLSKSDETLRRANVISSKMADAGVGFVADFISGRYKMNFDFITDPALSTAVNSFAGGYFSTLTKTIQDREKLAQMYRERIVNSVLNFADQSIMAPLLARRINAASTRFILPILAKILPKALGGDLASKLAAKAAAAQIARLMARTLAYTSLRNVAIRVLGRKLASAAITNLILRGLASGAVALASTSYLGWAALAIGVGAAAWSIFDGYRKFNDITRSNLFTENSDILSLSEFFKPAKINELTVKNMPLLINQAGLGFDKHVSTLFGTEWEDAVFGNTRIPDSQLNSVSSRVYNSANEKFGIDLRRFGVDNATILSLSSSMLGNLRGGFNENMAADILSYSNLYAGGDLSLQKSFYLISSTMSDYENSERLVSDGFSRFFAAVVGDGKPESAHFSLIEALSEFSSSYAASVKFNLDNSVEEVAEIYKFMSDNGTINGRPTASPVTGLITAIDDLLMSGAMGLNVASSSLFKNMAVTTGEAVRGVTADADVFEAALSGIFDNLNVSRDDVLNGSGRFDSALLNFQRRHSEIFSFEALGQLRYALLKYASGERISPVDMGIINSSVASRTAIVNENNNFFTLVGNVIFDSNKMLGTMAENITTIQRFLETLEGTFNLLFSNDGVLNSYTRLLDRLINFSLPPLPPAASGGSASTTSGGGSAAPAAAPGSSPYAPGGGGGSSPGMNPTPGGYGPANPPTIPPVGASGSTSVQNAPQRPGFGESVSNAFLGLFGVAYASSAYDNVVFEDGIGPAEVVASAVAPAAVSRTSYAGVVLEDNKVANVMPSGVKIAGNFTEDELYFRVYNQLRGYAKENFTREFFNGLANLSKEFGIPLDYFLTLINLESSFNPANINYYGGAPYAIGLFQYVESTYAEVFGESNSWENLASLSSFEQLPYIRAYLVRPWLRTRIDKAVAQNSSDLENLLVDVYLIPFAPGYVGDSTNDSFVLYSKETTPDAYAGNEGLDKNKDGLITRGDIKVKLKGLYSDLFGEGHATGGRVNRGVRTFQSGSPYRKPVKNVEIFIPIMSTNPSRFASGFASIMRTGLRG
jgi:hypothetical protein